MGKIHTFKDGKLHIYVRTDKYKNKLKSNNYVGRTYITQDGKGRQLIKSSGFKNLNKAKQFLFKWFERQHFKLEHNIQISQSMVKDLYQQFLNDVDNDSSIEGITKKGYKDRWNLISKCKTFLNLKVETMEANDVKNTFLLWRYNRAKGQSKTLRGNTISGDLIAIQKFITWCYDKKIRNRKISLRQTLSRKLKSEQTLRAQLSKEQYNHILKASRKRYQSGRTLRIRFNRERLHQFIVFMVGTGLRVDECLNLHFEDVEMCDRQKSKAITQQEIKLDEHSRYYLKIYLRKSKTDKREVIGLSSSYFALKRLLHLYQTTGLGKISGNIWNVQSFREGLNTLLNEANLKKIRKGDRTLSVDSKSFRSTYIQFMLDKGITIDWLAKNCGTSIIMIEKYYTAHRALDSVLAQVLHTGRTKLKAVS